MVQPLVSRAHAVLNRTLHAADAHFVALVSFLMVPVRALIVLSVFTVARLVLANVLLARSESRMPHDLDVVDAQADKSF